GGAEDSWLVAVRDVPRYTVERAQGAGREQSVQRLAQRRGNRGSYIQRDPT
ncbi:unnamed protein product, partial [Ectocarpus sp. 13 AM-2016]